MVLNDSEIRNRINAGLMTDHDLTRIKNCAYTLRAGKVFAPETGEEQIVTRAKLRIRHVWRIGPSEVLVVRTKEKINMPADLCATYAPLFRLSRQGLMLINASLVEPHYEGRLSCFLLNFSSRAVTIKPDEAIAKITFHQLSAAPTGPVAESVDDATYERGLAESASLFHRSFMDIAGIADRAAEKATQSAKSAVVYGGLILGVLLAWAQFEPLVSTMVRKAVGWPTNAAERAADEKLKIELDSKLKEFESSRKTTQIENDLLTLKNELRDLKARVKKQ